MKPKPKKKCCVEAEKALSVVRNNMAVQLGGDDAFDRAEQMEEESYEHLLNCREQKEEISR